MTPLLHSTDAEDPTRSAPYAGVTEDFGPYAVYARMRGEGRVLWSDAFFGGGWVLTSFDDVQSVLRDKRFAAQRTGRWIREGAAEELMRSRPDLKRLQSLAARAMLFVDRPDHPRLRKAMQVGFHPSRVQQIRVQVERIADELIEAIDREVDVGQPFDFIERFAKQLPARTVAAFLGIADPERSRFTEWAAHIARLLGEPGFPDARTLMSAASSLSEMVEVLEREIDGRRHVSGHDLLGHLVSARKAGEIRDEVELLAQCAMLLFAGHETTRHALGTAIYWLLGMPGARHRLVTEPTLVPSAVRELLRWDSPIQYTARRATTDVVLHGQSIRRGELVVLMLGAANRDPARYDAPDEFQVERPVGLPLSFGVGPHVCIGAGLSMMELEIAVGRILHRWPGLSLSRRPAAWIEQPLYRGLEALWLERA